MTRFRFVLAIFCTGLSSWLGGCVIGLWTATAVLHTSAESRWVTALVLVPVGVVAAAVMAWRMDMGVQRELAADERAGR